RPSRCRLRVLDVTGLRDDDVGRAPAGMSVWSGTVALAKACLELSKLQRELQRAGFGNAAPPSIDVRADLFVSATSFGVVWDALRVGNSAPLRLRCRELQAEELSPAGIVNLLESLEPSGLRRVELRFNNLGLQGLSAVLPCLARFPELWSLRLPYSNVDVRREAAPGIRCLATELGKLQGLRELNLGSSRLSGSLGDVLCELQTPLESLELAFCSLLPSDLSFLCRSPHAPALKRLDLSGHDFSRGLLRPLRQLLEEASPSLLHLDLMECRLGDSQLESLLASLRRCSRLRSLGLFGNSVSRAGLGALVRETAALPELSLVVYPIPTDCYGQGTDPGQASEEHLDRECLGALGTELERLLESSGRAGAVWTCDPYGHAGLDFFSL
ncbi:leucine-rich repeat-containing protein 14-like, partial [Myiozetetes cayanensis]|uniref:leucine-rich repeat-containing protein 14-like n=1 Tax=Myiozetetes cayanensis TaxID=478635 RepID=UPI00215E85AB